MVELVVGLTVLAVGIVGIIGVVNSTFGLAVGNNDRSRAVALATKELETLRATPWSQLTAQTDATPREVVVGTRTYRVARAVTDTPSGKEATVEVSWTGAGDRVSDVHQATKIYSSGDGGASAASAAVSGALVAPTAVLATVPSEGAGGSIVDLTWTNPVPGNPTGSTLVVEWSIDNFSGSNQRLTERLAATANRIRVPGLSAGTTYSFRIGATDAAGTMSAWSPIATVTTPVSVSATCTYGSATVTPSHIRRHASSPHRLVQAVRVSVNTTGTCTGLHVVYRTNPEGPVSTWLMVQSAGGVWTAALPEVVGAWWAVGVHELSIRDQLETERATAYLTVCDYGVASC
jgi:hypothetical protein